VVKPVSVFVNTPPVIEPEEIITPAGSVKTLNLIEITSDAEGNLDPNSFSIVSQPISNAVASIEFVSDSQVNLLIDYQGISFSGVDQMTIRACDDAAACSDRVLAIEVDVESGVVVYNAIAPNSSGDNKIMRITGLPEGNKVSIFNRWGDKVYDVENYQNISSGNAFQGLNQNGNALPSGVYFYTIEIPGRKQMTGYLTLKQ
jgi:gliding motility-associated-like protein